MPKNADDDSRREMSGKSYQDSQETAAHKVQTVWCLKNKKDGGYDS
jgi:hypothetical protein